MVNSGLSAETGGASGGSINVITRDGRERDPRRRRSFSCKTERWTPAIHSRPGPSRPTLHRYRTGVALGGPIVKDRTFYYAAFEQEHRPLARRFVHQSGGGRLPSIAFSPAGVSASVHAPDQRRSFPRFARGNRSIRQGQPSTDAAQFPHAALCVHQQSRGGRRLQHRRADRSQRARKQLHPGQRIGGSVDFRLRSAIRRRLAFSDRGPARRCCARTTCRPGNRYRRARRFRPALRWQRPPHRDARPGDLHVFARRRASLWKAGATVNHVHEDAAMADGFGGLLYFRQSGGFRRRPARQFRQAFGACRYQLRRPELWGVRAGSLVGDAKVDCRSRLALRLRTSARLRSVRTPTM